MTRAVNKDIFNSLQMWRFWVYLSVFEIKQRYRRSSIGPFWLTISLGIQVGAIGTLSSLLFNQKSSETMPYFSVSLVIWSFITTVINDSCNCIISSNILIYPKPITLYFLQNIFRNIILLLHHTIVILFVFYIYDYKFNYNLIYLIFTLPIFLLDLLCITSIIGIYSARFRDLPSIIASLLVILFWVTPVFYKIDQLNSKKYLAEWNPLYHLLEVVRLPVLGYEPSTFNYLFFLVFSLVLIIVSYINFSFTKNKITYWI